MKSWKKFGLLLLILFLLTACRRESKTEIPTINPTMTAEISLEPSATPVSTLPSLTYSPMSFTRLTPDTILLQLGFEPTFSTPRYQYPFGRVPELTMLVDGRIFYQDDLHPDQPLRVAQLSPAEMMELLQEIVDLGINELDSYTDFCLPQEDGSSICVADAAYTIIRQRMPDDSLKEIRSYANFTNQPEILEAIVQRLNNYTHPEAQAYIPEQAALFLQPTQGKLNEPPTPFPLQGNYAPPALNDSGMWAFYLTGADLQTYLQTQEGKYSLAIFDINGETYQAELVSWLPGADYQVDLEAEFPPQKAGEIQSTNWLSPCPVKIEGRVHPGNLRLVYLDQNDLYLLEEDGEGSSTVTPLTASGFVTSFQISLDGVMVYYTQNIPSGARLWAMELFSGDHYPLSDIFPAGQKLELHSPSPDGTWLPFILLLDERNGELWAAQTNGGGSIKLIENNQLKGTDEYLTDCGAIPTKISWIPNSTRLLYDGLPICDGIFIYMPMTRYIDLATNQKGQFPPGVLVFDKNGYQAALKDIDHLSLVDANGDLVQQFSLPFHALGMGEWYLYPEVSWENGDEALLVVTSQETEANWENFGFTPMTLYRQPIDGGSAQELVVLEGSPWSFSFAPDSETLSYYTVIPDTNDRTLYLARTDSHAAVEYDHSELLEFLGWSPDSQHFVYSTRGTKPEIQNWIGDTCGPALPFYESGIHTLRWLNAEHFVFEVNQYDDLAEVLHGSTRLYLDGLSQTVEFLVEFSWEQAPQWKAIWLPYIR
jgi:hypothetical protein